jgi:hypothetical protein
LPSFEVLAAVLIVAVLVGDTMGDELLVAVLIVAVLVGDTMGDAFGIVAWRVLPFLLLMVNIGVVVSSIASMIFVVNGIWKSRDLQSVVRVNIKPDSSVFVDEPNSGPQSRDLVVEVATADSGSEVLKGVGDSGGDLEADNSEESPSTASKSALPPEPPASSRASRGKLNLGGEAAEWRDSETGDQVENEVRL